MTPTSVGWPGLDFVRFLGVTFMILIHAFFWLATEDGRMQLDPNGLVAGALPVGMVVGFFPLMLPFTAGCSLRLRLGSEPALPVLPWSQVGRMVVTGALVAAMGFALNFCASGVHVLWAWNVLPTVGLGIACTAFLVRRGRVWPLAVAGVMAVFLAAPLRAWLLMAPTSDAAAATYPGQGALWAASDWYVTKALVGDPSAFHVWPFVPWFGTIVAGFGLAHVYLSAGERGKMFRWGMPAVGAALMGAAALMGDAFPGFSREDLIGSPLFLASPGLVTALIGVAAVLTAVSTTVFVGHRFAPGGFVSCLSRGVLWVYFVHTLVGVWLDTWIIDAFDRAEIFRQPLVPGHLVLLVGIPAVLLGVSWVTGRLAVRWLDGKRIRINLRKVPSATVRRA